MRHLCSVAVLTAALLPAAAGAQEGVVLKTLPIPVGTKYKMVRGSVMAMDMETMVAGKRARCSAIRR